jgi:hypothetical protein
LQLREQKVMTVERTADRLKTVTKSAMKQFFNFAIAVLVAASNGCIRSGPEKFADHSASFFEAIAGDCRAIFRAHMPAEDVPFTKLSEADLTARLRALGAQRGYVYTNAVLLFVGGGRSGYGISWSFEGHSESVEHVEKLETSQEGKRQVAWHATISSQSLERIRQ